MAKHTDREKAKQLYIESKGGLKLTEIAEQLDRSPSTIRSWKRKDDWDTLLVDSVYGEDDTTQQQDNATQRKTTTQRKKTSQQKTTSKKNAKTKKQDKKRVAKEIKEVVNNDELNDKQKLFCTYYLKYFNATKAYQKAYECDYATANVNGFKTLVNTSIKSEIERLKAERMADVYLDSKAIMQRYIDIAFADLTDYIEIETEEIVCRDEYGEIIRDEEGNPVKTTESRIALKNSEEIDGTLVSEVSSNKSGIKIKLHDKMKALEWLSKNITSYQGELDISLMQERIKKEQATIRKIEQETEKNTYSVEEVKENNDKIDVEEVTNQMLVMFKNKLLKGTLSMKDVNAFTKLGNVLLQLQENKGEVEEGETELDFTEEEEKSLEELYKMMSSKLNNEHDTE